LADCVARHFLASVDGPPHSLGGILRAYAAAEALTAAGLRASAIHRIYQPLIRQHSERSAALKQYGLVSEELDFLRDFFEPEFRELLPAATIDATILDESAPVILLGSESLLLSEAAFCFARLGHSKVAFDLALQAREYADALAAGVADVEDRHFAESLRKAAEAQTVGTRLRLAAAGFNDGSVLKAAGETLSALRLLTVKGAKPWEFGEAFAAYARYTHESHGSLTASFSLDLTQRRVVIFPHMTNEVIKRDHAAYHDILHACGFSTRLDYSYLVHDFAAVDLADLKREVPDGLLDHTTAWFVLAEHMCGVGTLLGYWGLKFVEHLLEGGRADLATRMSHAMVDIWGRLPETHRDADAHAYHQLAIAYCLMARSAVGRSDDLAGVDEQFERALGYLRICGDYVEMVAAMLASVRYDISTGNARRATMRFQRIERYASGVVCRRLRRDALLVELELRSVGSERRSSDLSDRVSKMMAECHSDGHTLVLSRLLRHAEGNG
jgi:hypothetical protein